MYFDENKFDPHGGPASNVVANQQREHHWDMTRAALMLLGIPYHTITLGYDWSALLPQDSAQAMFLADVIHSFRMPAFFIVAGYFTGLLLMRKNPGEWFRGRLVRLGIPFLTCALLLSPLQMLIDQLGVFGLTASWHEISAGWTTQLTTPGSHWIRHLWFLPALLWLSLIVAAAHVVIPDLKGYRLPGRLDAMVKSHPWVTMLILLGITVVFAVFGRAAVFLLGAASHPIIQMVNFQGAAAHLPFFIVGVVLPRSTSLLGVFVNFRLAFFAGAIVASVVYALLDSNEGAVITIVKIGLVCIAGLLWAHVFFSVAYRWFDKQSNAVRHLVDASFVIYLFHQPILTALKIVTIEFGMNPEISFLIITALTIAITYVIYLGVIQFQLTNLLFNGVYKPASSQPAPNPAAKPTA